MSAQIENFLIGVLANATWSFLSSLFGSGSRAPNSETSFRSAVSADGALTTILMKASASVARSPAANHGAAADAIRQFLVSPEIDSMLWQLYAALVSRSGSEHLDQARRLFLSSLSLHLGKPEQDLEALASELFEALQKGCERALEIAIDRGVLSAHDAKSAARHQLILDELATIKEELTFLTSSQKPSIPQVLEFEAKYRDLVGIRHADMTPPHFDAAHRVPIGELFVPPDFVWRSPHGAEEAKTLSLQQFQSSLYRVVLLGDPGAGKSTVATTLCHDLAVHYADRLVGGRLLTPILVILREYGVDKQLRRCSLVQHIEATANATYQLAPPVDAVRYLLLSGRVMVVFDGLDELLDTHDRTGIVRDIESFCALYPSVPTLVTSRVVGYDQAPLDETRFEVYRLAEFNTMQVREYAIKWFAADVDLPPTQRGPRAEAFLAESASIPDLRANPLMLALICGIYRGDGYIPRNRPDVYEKCAVMLFERWDKGRGIRVPLPFEAHIGPTMKQLAYSIYTTGGLEGGVRESQLIEMAAAYLHRHRFEDPDEATAAARVFIEFCKGRAWVFRDVGVDRKGELLYQFTHRTFLEYFAAAHLLRIHPTPEGLAGVLLPRIAVGQWDAVALLAFALQGKNVEGAADHLLDSILAASRAASEEEAWSLLSFAARALEFLVPQPRIAGDVAVACAERCIAWGEARSDGTLRGAGALAVHAEPIILLVPMLLAAEENRPPIADRLRRAIVGWVFAKDDERARLALEMGLNLSWFPQWGSQALGLGWPADAFWSEQSSKVFEDCMPRILTLAQRDEGIAQDALLKGAVSVKQFVEWFGVSRIFAERRYRLCPRAFRFSPPERLGRAVLWGHIMPLTDEQRRVAEGCLSDLGRLLESAVPIRRWGRPEKWGSWGVGEASSALRLVPSDVAFGILFAWAVTWEAVGVEEWNSVNSMREKKWRPGIASLLGSRFESGWVEPALRELETVNLTEDQRAVIERWLRRERDFVEGVEEKGYGGNRTD